ncbi:hypothetical protein MAPG_05028 [Magnaporthiopsis poae ATCC 64411]|uniref:Uncharacterized protein n=1 Tax=Magnaporthiopsis poae (strain ATCC 64411 / 73-15) TaxID=644358 RepID=A0A0C4DYB1_MAGP6|nr:hypothetical protein MAPG_05028 [Magnaporthiopsis poae ATCC 64411]
MNPVALAASESVTTRQKREEHQAAATKDGSADGILGDFGSPDPRELAEPNLTDKSGCVAPIWAFYITFNRRQPPPEVSGGTYGAWSQASTSPSSPYLKMILSIECAPPPRLRPLFLSLGAKVIS